MTLYIKKPEIVEATQWFKNGDHPEDNCPTVISDTCLPFPGEGEVVRYYRSPDFDSSDTCGYCGEIMHNHGWIDIDFYDGYIVCPGDWIITKNNDFHAIKKAVFERDYEEAEERNKIRGKTKEVVILDEASYLDYFWM